ncbi:MAG: hypothetical protein ABIQ09_16050 [Jatrophihabitantaceae bacterium]
MTTEAATWAVIKYQPDVRRGEPRNVGIMVSVGQDVQLEFLGEVGNGRIDGRSVTSTVGSVDNYKRWVAYFRRAASQGRFEAVVERWQERRTESNFYVGEPGSIELGNRTLPDVTASLFGDLVGPRIDVEAVSPEHQAEDALLRQVFERLNVQPVPQPKRNITAEGVEMPIIFDFGYRNGQLHLMDHLRMGSSNVTTRKAAFDFTQRAQFARQANWSDSFIAFYVKPSRHLTEQAEAALSFVNRLGHTIDLTDLDSATQETAHALHI